MVSLVKIKENTYVNPQQITAIVLYEHQGLDGDGYIWRFFLSSGDYVSSNEFQTEEEAVEWFKSLVKTEQD